MKRLFIYLLFTAIVAGAAAQPRPVKLSSTVIIDTDCGFDDLRALSLLLARPEITIKAILTCDGSLTPDEGAMKVGSLLYDFRKENIPVAAGETIENINPAWRPFNRSISWGEGNPTKSIGLKAPELLQKILNSENQKITLVCLGPLTNIGRVIKADPQTVKKIDRIIWYNAVNPLQGFNYECDKLNADVVLNSGLRIDAISSAETKAASFDLSLVKKCDQSTTELAKIFNHIFKQPSVYQTINDGHFRLGDDLVAIYIMNPELFSINADLNRLNIRFNKDFDVAGVKETITDMIDGSYVSERNIVFNRFPVNREMFNYDIRPIIDTTIAMYGYDEWKANVMTDEFHGHLGVFSIVGAKMGIRAREIFGVGPDMLDVTTYAGLKPPYSCLTDGIQVSTGATLGMGTIHLANEKKALPSAVFTYNDRSVRITLKKEYLEKVDADIKEGIMKFGLMDDGYWKLIRHNALRYWVEWDRNKIFDVEEIVKK